MAATVPSIAPTAASWSAGARLGAKDRPAQDPSSLTPATSRQEAVAAYDLLAKPKGITYPATPSTDLAIPPGRFLNPGRNGDSELAPLAFGPSEVSALTRTYDAQGRLQEGEPQAVGLFQQPRRGLNILA